MAYESDSKVISELFYSIAKVRERILDNSQPFVVFEEYGDYSLNFTLRILSYKIYQLETEDDLRTTVYEKLRESNIEIPM